MNDLVTIRDILLQKSQYDGWLYLPDGALDLDSKGVFIRSDNNADPESIDHIPDVVKNLNLKVTIDSETVEDIVFNASAQIKNISLEKLFMAFSHYIKNDAFLNF